MMTYGKDGMNIFHSFLQGWDQSSWDVIPDQIYMGSNRGHYLEQIIWSMLCIFGRKVVWMIFRWNLSNLITNISKDWTDYRILSRQYKKGLEKAKKKCCQALIELLVSLCHQLVGVTRGTSTSDATSFGRRYNDGCINLQAPLVSWRKAIVTIPENNRCNNLQMTSSCRTKKKIYQTYKYREASEGRSINFTNSGKHQLKHHCLGTARKDWNNLRYRKQQEWMHLCTEYTNPATGNNNKTFIPWKLLAWWSHFRQTWPGQPKVTEPL